MVEASKILTVSYGTFSCTLEGFDEPFSTMKAIAEYFRDLAAEDRYFGAEPPTPDAEMLHRIAEREIQRRVEAKISEHGIVLRPQEAAEAAPAAEPRVAAAIAAAPVIAATEATAEATPAAQPHVAEAPAPEMPKAEVAAPAPQKVEPATSESADSDSIAAKLMRIRAVVDAARSGQEEIEYTAEKAELSFEDEEPSDEFATGAATVPAGDFGFELDLDKTPAIAEDAAEALVDAQEDDAEDTVYAVLSEAEAEPEAAEEVALEPVVSEDSLDEDFDDEWEADLTAAPEGTIETEAEGEAEDVAAFDEATEVAEEIAVEDEVTSEIVEPEVTILEEDFADVDASAQDETIAEIAALEEEEPEEVMATEEVTVSEDEAEPEAVAFEAEEEAIEFDATNEEEFVAAIEADEAVVAEAEMVEAEGKDEVLAEAEIEEEVTAFEEASELDEDAFEDDLVAEDTIEEEIAALESEADAEETAFEVVAEDEPVSEDASDDEDSAITRILAVDDAETASEEEWDEEEEAEDGIAALIAETRADHSEEIADMSEEAIEDAFADEAEEEAEEVAASALDLSAWRVEESAPAVEDEVAENAIAETETAGSEPRSSFLTRAARVVRLRRATPEAEEAEAEHAAMDTLSDADETDFDLEMADDSDVGDDDDRDIAAALDDAVGAEAREIELNAEEALEDFDVAARDETEERLLAGIDEAIGSSAFDLDDDGKLMGELSEMAKESRRNSHEGRALLESSSTDEDGSVERLMEEAKSKLEGDESRRRFSAISHLKAAVAATVADRKLKSKEAPSETGASAPTNIDRYREDLSKAVRPRRPASESASSTPRPTLDQRPSPLVLVSEQRIDKSAEALEDGSAVRPRRVSASRPARARVEEDTESEQGFLSPEDASSFAEFADRLGANGLSDLLEAAAAYTATVEGQPHFSRPQILSKIAYMSEEEEFSREDGLRSFGMLLREGKIQKISRGQFRITDASRFMSEARRASR